VALIAHPLLPCRGARRGGRVARWAAFVSAAALALLGCSAPDDPATAYALRVEQAFREQLHYIGSHAGRITFTLTTDRDAALTLDDPTAADREQIDVVAVQQAIDKARADAERYRTLSQAFARCGYPLTAIEHLGGAETAWTVAPLRGIPAVADAVLACVEDLPTDDPYRLPRVKVADPATSTHVEPQNSVDQALPAVLHFGDPKRIRALRDSFHHVLERWHVGPRIQPIWPPEEWDDIADRLTSTIDQWLDTQGIPHVIGLEISEHRHLLGHAPERMRYYQAVCSQREASWRCIGPMLGVAAVTVDTSTLDISDPRLIAIHEPGDIPVGRPIEPGIDQHQG
jgi:hypothetical protein